MSLEGVRPSDRLVLVDELLGHRHYYEEVLASTALDISYVSPGKVSPALLAAADFVLIDIELRTGPCERTRIIEQSLKLIEQIPDPVGLCLVASGLTPDDRCRFEEIGVNHILRGEDVYHSSVIASKLLLSALVEGSDGKRQGGAR